MNDKAEFAELQGKVEALLDAVTPIVAKYKAEQEAEDRARAEANEKRNAITQGPDGRWRYADGRVAPPRAVDIAMAQDMEAADAEEKAEQLAHYQAVRSSMQNAHVRLDDPRLIHPATPGPTGRDAMWPADETDE